MRIDLTDEELALLDGRCRPEVQVEVDQAKRRLESAERLAHLPQVLAGFVADVVSCAEKGGLLVWENKMVRLCSLCGESPGYVLFKRGPRKGQPNYKKPKSLPGVELARRFVTIAGHANLGGCRACVDLAVPDIREALRDVRAQLPKELRAEGARRYVKHDNMVCSACKWEGHKGEMKMLRALMGGDYPGRCPACGAENLPFGATIIGHADGLTIVEASS